MSKAAANLSSRLFSAKAVPIRYLVIPKCGCTFVKNLLWTIDHGSPFQDPPRIHDVDAEFLRASDVKLNLSTIRNEERAFTVVRNPIDRFFSLYSDKVIGDGHKRYVPLRKILLERHSLIGAPSTVSDHKRNCYILIEWLAENLESEQELKREAHWTPQSYRKNIFEAFSLKMLLTDDLTSQISILLSGVVPNIDQLISNTELNKSGKNYPKNEILDHGLRRRINQVYSADRKLYNSVRKKWQELKGTPFGVHNIPRYDLDWLSE